MKAFLRLNRKALFTVADASVGCFLTRQRGATSEFSPVIRSQADCLGWTLSHRTTVQYHQKV